MVGPIPRRDCSLAPDTTGKPWRVLVAVPVFNEAESLPAVIESLEDFRQARDFVVHVLFVNDGSRDGSGDIIRRAAERNPGCFDYINKSINEGYGASLISAFCYAQTEDYDWLITMDCDGQHEVSDLRRFMAADPALAVVSGSRYHPLSESRGEAPPDRPLINFKITDLLNREYGLGITDAFCGYKRYKIAAFREARFNCRGYAFPMEVWAWVARQGLRVEELPVRKIYLTDDRSFGQALDVPAHRYHHYLDEWENWHRKYFGRDLPWKKGDREAPLGSAQNP